MSEDNKKAWCGFNGWQPVMQHEDCINATYTAPLDLNDGAWSKIRKTISNAKHGEFYVFDSDGNASIAIGDTPEQTSDTIMIDGKIVTREDVCRLQSERNELADEVEALKDWRRLALQFDGHRMQAMSMLKMVASGKFDIEEVKKFIAAAPVCGDKHLRDARAEAGRAGYLQGIHDWQLAESEYEDFDTQSRSAQYAKRLKDGEE